MNNLLTKKILMNDEDIIRMNNIVIDLLNNQLYWNQYHIYISDLILRISNIYYNNTSMERLPLNDGLYDQLLIAHMRYNPNYQVGATPIQFNEFTYNEYTNDIDKKVLFHTIPKDAYDNKLYIKDLKDQYPHTYHLGYPAIRDDINQESISKRLINTQHKYPELVGTLDKCKFVLNNDAYLAQSIDNPSVKIFERDFIAPLITNGIITPTEQFEMVAELKYDGISIEAEVLGDEIISAYSRGDTKENIATDLTPILKHYKFYNASEIPKDKPFGIKFEAVITYMNLQLLAQARGKSYKNGRNAIIGLFGASDAFKYVDFITLIPLSTSLEMNRLDELAFLNKYYSTGEFNRHCVLRGNYVDILYQVKQFTESAEILRSILPYMIDGVVISFIDPYKIQLLGRVNSVNKYQMAIKFNANEVRTIFLGYSYNMGKSGEIIPIVHFKPVEFIGTIHTKQSIHSLQRFKELGLVKGQEIDVKYVNDVLTYVTKPDTEFNRQLQQQYPMEQFITTCPYCGSEIEVSDTGKMARCSNPMCHERRIMRMTDMLDRLGFKDISEETVRSLNLTSFTQLMDPYGSINISILGDLTLEKFMKYILNLKYTPIPDYKIMAALSFEAMAEEKWKRIFKHYNLKYLLGLTEFQLKEALITIHGIGNLTIQSVLNGFYLYRDEIESAIINLTIIDSKNTINKPKVALTGFRDPMAIDIINSAGYDCDEKYNVTKNTSLLITNDKNSTSSKISKANKYHIPIMTFEEFCQMHNITIGKF